MLIRNADLLFNDPWAFALQVSPLLVALVIGVSFHEFAHAAAATVRGDFTAKRLGRLTLNPKAHLSLSGSIMLLIVGFGWGKPVPIDISRLRGGRREVEFVSAAGPASNVMLALAFASFFRVGLLPLGGLNPSGLQDWLTETGAFLVYLNLILAVFNLLPMPPLDGGGILAGLAPRSALPLVRQLQKIGPIVLVGVLLSTYVTNLNILGTIFDPVLGLTKKLIGG
jgi:Zn-dependent protease